MPPLTNARHERFVQSLFKGEPASTAYSEAGYVPNDGNAIRLKGNERVKARLAELQEEAARSAEVSVASLLAELEQARAKATNLDQLSAAINATLGKAKISGLLVQRSQVEVSGQIDFFDSRLSMEDIILEALKGSVDSNHVEFLTQADIDRFREAFLALTAVGKAIGDEVKARYYAAHAPRGGYSQRAIELERITNGSGNRRS